MPALIDRDHGRTLVDKKLSDVLEALSMFT
jgi:hypothetical protein